MSDAHHKYTAQQLDAIQRFNAAIRESPSELAAPPLLGVPETAQEWAKRIIHEASEASLKAGYAHKEKKSDRLSAYSENVDWDSQRPS